MTESVTLAEYNAAMVELKKIRTSTGKYPDSLKIGTKTVNRNEYFDMIARVRAWVKEKAPELYKIVDSEWRCPDSPKCPKIVYIKRMPAPEPLNLYEVAKVTLMKQPTGYHCGPTSLAMLLSELCKYAPYSPTELGVWADTTTSGTGHDGVFRAARKAAEKLGFKIKTYELSMASTEWKKLGEMIADDKIGVIAHIMTYGLDDWSGDWGHYVFPIGLKLKEKMIRIADPGRSVAQTYWDSFDRFLRACNRVTWTKSLLIIERI